MTGVKARQLQLSYTERSWDLMNQGVMEQSLLEDYYVLLGWGFKVVTCALRIRVPAMLWQRYVATRPNLILEIQLQVTEKPAIDTYTKTSYLLNIPIVDRTCARILPFIHLFKQIDIS